MQTLLYIFKMFYWWSEKQRRHTWVQQENQQKLNQWRRLKLWWVTSLGEKKRTLAAVYVQGAGSMKCRYTGGSAAAGSRAGAPMEGPTGGQAALGRWNRGQASLLDEHARWKCVSQAEGQSKACTVVWRGSIPAVATLWHLERTMRVHTSDQRRSGSSPARYGVVWRAWWVGSRQAVGQSRCYSV